MANTASNVLVGRPLATGGILVAPLPATLPTSATSTPNAAFDAAGYVSSDGVIQTLGTDVTEIKAWGGDIVRRIQTSHDLTYAFTLIETNEVSLTVYYGDENVTVGTGTTAVEIKAGDLPRKAWLVEIKDGDKRVRIVIPDGQVTDRGDITYADENAIAYELTLTCYPDSSGVKAYIYTDDDGVSV